MLKSIFKIQKGISKNSAQFYCETKRVMDITSDLLREKLINKLNIEHLEIVDESNCGCGYKFNAIIVSDDFKGKPYIQRQRMVNSILEEEMKQIHAFSQQTLTVEQWQTKNKK